MKDNFRVIIELLSTVVMTGRTTCEHSYKQMYHRFIAKATVEQVFNILSTAGSQNLTCNF